MKESQNMFNIEREYLIYVALKNQNKWKKVVKEIGEFLEHPTFDKEYKKDDYKKYDNVIIFSEKEYPVDLTTLEEPPFLLFYKGDISLLSSKKNKYLGIVGSRKMTRYGEKMVEVIVNDLPKNSIIISGLAKGIDAKAHQEALNNNLKTIAILGTPIDVVYPEENERLYQEIIAQGGLILSEFPPKTPTEPENFLFRNRLIASFSNTILLVESYGRSGALNTCTSALEMGKDVGCCPSLALLSSNCNKLIKDGATLVENYQDLRAIF